MTRPFALRDIPWLYRMRRRMLVLDSRQAYTQPTLMLHDLLFNHADLSSLYCRLIEDDGARRPGRIIGQFYHRPGQRHARLSFLGPEERLEQASTTALLEGLIAEAGQRGAHMLIAEVDEKSTIFELLRHTGFAIFARQRIWHTQQPPLETPMTTAAQWRTATPEDRHTMQHLYINIVPPLVQQVDPDPFESNHHFWVHCQGGDMVAILDVTRGPLGVRLQPYFHPAVQPIQALLTNFLTHYRAAAETSLYVCVRSYQGGFALPMQELGFSPCSDQAVMVRRLTAAVHQNVTASLPALDGTQPEPTAPISRYDG